jgi:XTP/dITP diphosphohydrolase
MPKIILATSNLGKVRELADYLKILSFDFIAQSEFDVPEIAETGLTFVENALIKARWASQQTGLPAIADDSGLVVDALDGAPGIYSARYAGEKANMLENINKLLDKLKPIPKEKRTARFYCILVFLTRWDDPLPIIAEGVWEGLILDQPQGTQGFGYDPIFYAPTHHCSAAELSHSEKMKISHRGLALEKLLERFSQHFT